MSLPRPDASPLARTTTSTPTHSFSNPEQLWQHARNQNPRGSSAPRSSISVEHAEADFHELQRRLSQHSNVIHDRPPSGPGAPFDVETSLREGRGPAVKPKHIGVCWEDLTVKGLDSPDNSIPTFADALLSLVSWNGLKSCLGYKSQPTEITLLDGFRGVAKPGEMILVLGRPGSGCTTFLKSIANQRSGYSTVLGDVLYGDLNAEEFKDYRGEAVYNQEDDIHIPTLTVEQTLRFALDLKTPKDIVMSGSSYKDMVISTLLKMFNLYHVRDTVVGDALIRGVSGGERKRVSIAEMMTTNSCVLSWDNSTRGLDASTALDFIKALRVYTNLYRTVTFVSLYQASENIYRQFDKVLVIDAGKQVFFGPTASARDYFEGVGFAAKPRQTTPDYLTGCTDKFEREYREGFSAQNAPYSPATLATTFLASSQYEKLEEEISLYKSQLGSSLQGEFQRAVSDSKSKIASRTAYAAGFHTQVWALMRRQFTLRIQDRLGLCLIWMRTIIIAILLGTLYFDRDQSSASAFSKSGLLFISVLFNVFESFSELFNSMMVRAIIEKHRAFTFYHPSALWVAQIFVDTAFSASRIMLFSIIVYFMSNLTRGSGAGPFLIFYAGLLAANIAMTLFFRTVGCLSNDPNRAFSFAAVVITLSILTSGYVIAWQSQQVWLRWLFYINIPGLVFEVLMLNEFSHSQLQCADDSLVPAGPSYANADLQTRVCAFPGAVAGSQQVDGAAYLSQAYSFESSDLARNFGIVLGLIIVFLMMNIIVGHFIKSGLGARTFKIFRKSDATLEKLNQALREKRPNSQRHDQTMEKSDGDFQMIAGGVLTWENLSYDVHVPGGTRPILSHVSGYVKPGQLTALMGASGAGKTTLLDVLAKRKNIGVISNGDILVNGAKPGEEYQRSISYAEQFDHLHEPTQTIREALQFSADLRQPIETPQSEKYAYVEEVISLLELESIADAMIGSPEGGPGVSIEERKRLTIGVELAARPQLLLFLDEPTSGLDSQSAFNIVRLLRKLASAGQTILCTIHQPNAALFESFDRLLLLYGGKTVYFGEIGKDAITVRNYLARHGAVAGASDNVAEYMLEAIGAGVTPRIGDKDWAGIWDESQESAQIIQSIQELNRAHYGGDTHKMLHQEYASPLTHQLRLVIGRMNLVYWRSPDYTLNRLSNHLIIALLTGLAFLQLDNSRSALQYKVFAIFELTVLPLIITAQVETMYHLKRNMFYREQSAKTYSNFVFAISMVLAELPYSIAASALFFFPLYYLPGFQPSRAGYQFLIVLTAELFSVTLGQMLAAATPSAVISSQFDPFLVMTFLLFCGVTIPPPQMPDFWRAWLYPLDPFTRMMGGMVTTALHDVVVECTSNEYVHFSAPGTQACGDYMSAFFDAGGLGYVKDNATTACEYCAYKVGDQFFESMGFSYGDRWRDMGIFLGFVGVNLALLFIASRYLHFNRR